MRANGQFFGQELCAEPHGTSLHVAPRNDQQIRTVISCRLARVRCYARLPHAAGKAASGYHRVKPLRLVITTRTRRTANTAIATSSRNRQPIIFNPVSLLYAGPVAHLKALSSGRPELFRLRSHFLPHDCRNSGVQSAHHVHGGPGIFHVMQMKTSRDQKVN